MGQVNDLLCRLIDWLVLANLENRLFLQRFQIPIQLDRLP